MSSVALGRDGHGRFAKGVSGNPGGRPAQISEVRELARRYTKEAVATLVDIMQNPKAPPAAKVRAAEVLLDRGWGRPQQQLEIQEAAGLNIVISERIAQALEAGRATPPEDAQDDQR